MNCSFADLLTMFDRIGSLLVRACVCAGAHRINKPANLLENAVPASMVSCSSALIAEHVLAGATHEVGAGSAGKTSDFDRNRKPFGHTTSKQRLATKHA